MKRADFLAEVTKAAEKVQRRRRRMRTIAEASLNALAGARQADPMRGVTAARQVPRCGKIKRSDGHPCQAPRLRGASRCRWHGGLRELPGHPGNIRRLLGGTYARQAAYKLRMKAMSEHWDQLGYDEQKFIWGFMLREGIEDAEMVDLAARCWIEARENPWAWQSFLQHLRRRRKYKFQPTEM